MADSIKQHLKFIESFSSNLEKVNKNMNSFNSKLEESTDNFKDVNNQVDKVSIQYDDISKKTKENIEYTSTWGQKLKSIGSTIKNSILPVFGLTFGLGLITDTVGQVLNLDKEMTKLSFRMGKASGSAKQLKNDTLSVSQAVGIATDKSAELIGSLARLRTPAKDIRRLAIDTARFSEITGVSAEESARLSGELMRIGRLGRKSVSGILSDMVKVQKVVGMTEGEMSNLSDSIIYSSKMLQQMGKNAAHIEKFSKGTTKLAAAFAQVGIEAQAATQFVENLLDPGRIEDNAFLYSKLGVSIEDAISGNVDPGMLAGKFKDLGQELKDMSGPAAAAMAQSLGMPLGQLRQMAEMDLSELESVFGKTGDASSELAKSQAEALSTQEKFEKTMNRVKNLFVDAMDAFMPIVDIIANIVHGSGKDLTGMIKGWVDSFKASGGIEKFVGKIREGISFLKDSLNPKKLFGKILIGAAIFAVLAMSVKKVFNKTMFSVGRNISETISIGIEEGVKRGAEKSAIIAEKKISKVAAKKAADLQARVRMGEGYETIQRMADEFEIMSKAPMFALGEKFSSFMEKSLRSVSEFTKPFSKIKMLTEQNNKKIYEQMLMYKESGFIQDEMISKKQDEIIQQRRLYKERINYLNIQKGSRQLTIEEEDEVIKLTKMHTKLGNELKTVNKERSANSKLYNNLELDQLKRLGEDKLREIKSESIEKKKMAEINVMNAQREVDVHEAMKAAIDKELFSAQKKVEIGEMTYTQYQRLQKEQADLNLKIAEENSKLSSANQEIFESENILKRIAKTGRKIDIGAGSARVIESAGGKFNRFMKSSKNLLVTAGKNILLKGMNTAKALKEGAKSALATVKKMGVGGVFKGIKSSLFGRRSETGEKVGGGLGKVLGKIGKSFGPMMLIAGLLGRMQPVQDAIKKIMDGIKPIISKLGDFFANLVTKIFPAIMPLLTVLLERVLMPLIKFLMPPLLDILSFLLEVLGSLIKALGSLASVFSKEVGDSLKELGGSMKDAAVEMRIAAQQMRISNELESQSINTQVKTNAFLKDANKITEKSIGVNLESMDINALSDIEKMSMNKQMISALHATAKAFTSEKEEANRKLMTEQLKLIEIAMNKNMKEVDGLKGSLNKYSAEQIANNSQIQSAWDTTMKQMIQGMTEEDATRFKMMFKDMTPQEWREKGKGFWGMNWQKLINGSDILGSNLEDLTKTQQNAYAKQLGFSDWSELMKSGDDVDILKKVQDLQTKILKEQEKAGENLTEVASNTNPAEKITSWEAAELYASGRGIIEKEKIREITKGGASEEITAHNTKETAKKTEEVAKNTDILVATQTKQVKQEENQTELLEALLSEFREIKRLLKDRSV